MFSSNGRINRTSYLLGNLLISGMVLPLYTMNEKQKVALESDVGLAILALGILMCAILFIINLSIRRFHDLGISGWIALISIVPGVQILLMIIPGQKQKNRFGTEPTKLFDIQYIFNN